MHDFRVSVSPFTVTSTISVSPSILAFTASGATSGFCPMPKVCIMSAISCRLVCHSFSSVTCVFPSFISNGSGSSVCGVVSWPLTVRAQPSAIVDSVSFIMSGLIFIYSCLPSSKAITEFFAKIQ